MIGRSNVGKSTLLNSIVVFQDRHHDPKTPKPPAFPSKALSLAQRVRLFLLIPRHLTREKDALSKRLAQSVKASLKDIDAVAYVVDPTREIGQEEREVMRTIENMTVPRSSLSTRSTCAINRTSTFIVTFLRISRPPSRSLPCAAHMSTDSSQPCLSFYRRANFITPKDSSPTCPTASGSPS